MTELLPAQRWISRLRGERWRMGIRSGALHILLALMAGILCGSLVWAAPDSGLSAAISFIEPIGTIWVNAIRMTVIPLVVSLLFVSIASKSDTGPVGGLIVHTIFVMVGMMALWALFIWFVGPLIFEGTPLPQANIIAVDHAGAATIAQPTEVPSLAQWFIGLVPINPMRAAADGALLPLLVFTVAFAFAAGRLEDSRRVFLVETFAAVSDAMIILLRWIIALAPLGIFILTSALIARMGLSSLGSFAYFLGALCGMLTLQAIALYIVVAIFGKVGPARFARAVLPAQLVAFSSRSSLAALPALLEGARTGLKLRPEVSAFSIPFGVATFKFAAASSVPINAIFIARLYGVDLDTGELGFIAASSLLLSFTSPGIPSGSLIVLAPVFAQAGIPVEGIALLIAIDVIPDIFRTVLNVTGTLSVAILVARISELRSARRPAHHDQGPIKGE